MTHERSTEPAGAGVLPPLDERAVERIERGVFAAVALDRARARRRRQMWGGLAIAASLVVVAAVVSPALIDSLGGSTSSGASAPIEQQAESESAGSASGTASDEAADSGTADDATEREVAVTAELSIEVASTGEAAERVREIAAAHDGWIERLSVGTSGESDPTASEGMPGDRTEPSVTGIEPYPSPGPDEATLRVPADRLDAALADLGTLGEVQRTLVTRDDVTAHAVDLRARVSAAETSIARLTELMGEAASVADLLEVETQLAARQAELESARSELEAVEGRVAMSTVIVRFLTEPAPAEVEPSSPFLDGLLSGWNTLMAALGGMVAALGFLLPWLAPLGLIVLIVWAIRRRRTRTRQSAS